MLLLVTAIVQWLHVIFAIYWFGTILFTRMVLFPTLRRIPEHETAVRTEMVVGPARRLTIIASTGTVALGILRGALTGVWSDLATPYGITYLGALVIGLLMVSYITIGWPNGRPVYGKLYVAGFPVMFTLMVAMRFGY
ncbi:MAG: hypothetical protein E6J19_13505 [Chloroflexi bacterium]|nr:MAG: hypothetical protein E6J19_13505 [Chloroflexota bacterium]